MLLIYISMMTIAIEVFFMCLLAVYILALSNDISLLPIFNLDYFFIVDLQEFIMYFGSPWSDIHCSLFIY